MHRDSAIVELELEQHRVDGLAKQVDSLIALMRDLPTQPNTDVLADLRESFTELQTGLTHLFEDEETLLFPAIRQHFKTHGATLAALASQHEDLRQALGVLDERLGLLAQQWDPGAVEQAWAVADHIRSLFEEHTRQEDALLDLVDRQLTEPEHDALVRGLRKRRLGRNNHHH